MPNRTWTPATLYKRLREVLAEEGIDLEDDTTALTLRDVRDLLKQKIVDNAVADGQAKTKTKAPA